MVAPGGGGGTGARRLRGDDNLDRRRDGDGCDSHRDRPEPELLCGPARVLLPSPRRKRSPGSLFGIEIHALGVARRVLDLPAVEREPDDDRGDNGDERRDDDAAGRGHERADNPSGHDENTDTERGEIDQSDGRLRRVAEHLGSLAEACTVGLSSFSENAISAAKKSGVARMPATASGAFGARRIRATHSRPASSTRARNSRVRASRGADKICAGGLLPYHALVEEAHLVRDLAREPISCVARIIVIPSSASSRTSSRTSPTSCGSSALVISSSSMSFGFIASARAIATRCCCPPERRSGTRWPSPRARSVSSSSRPLAARPRATARAPRRRERHVLEHGHVREQVVRLEDDADLAAQHVDVDLPR